MALGRKTGGREKGTPNKISGTVRDNEGKVVLNGIKGLYDPALEKMPYVVEGVVGSVR